MNAVNEPDTGKEGCRRDLDDDRYFGTHVRHAYGRYNVERKERRAKLN